MMDFLKTRALL